MTANGLKHLINSDTLVNNFSLFVCNFLFISDCIIGDPCCIFNILDLEGFVEIY